MTPTLDNPRALRSASIETLIEAAAAVESWTAHEARMLDQVLRDHVLEAMLGLSDPEALMSLYRAVVGIVPRRHQAALQRLDQDWIARWEGWADLLDGRVAQLRNQAPSQQDLHHIKHVPEILELVNRHPGLTQTQVAEHLDLTPPNVTRLLRILEDHQRVDRRRVGTAKRVFPSKPRLLPGLEAALREKGKRTAPAVASVVGEVPAA